MHRDGAMPGLVNAFMPLVDLTAENGPTQLHTGYARLPDGEWAMELLFAAPTAVTPLLRKGQLLLFSYRVKHGGLANCSAAPRPVAYRVYAGPGVSDTHNFVGKSLIEHAQARAATVARDGLLQGRLVVCPATLWSSVLCEELGGEGWLCRVESLYGPSMEMVRISYVHAVDRRGIRCPDAYLPLEMLLEWRVVECDVS